ncbi:hypothetical protein CJ030_MR6G023779 [Morella rubra]|uniref:HMA domain-containing protein n=1 Tax=Morella rubra TaxID=262757 RepID=A0A6A1VC54_9ROSI|nr:hypothetical protein CJ030_MR6G023779 [Morella rubra]
MGEIQKVTTIMVLKVDLQCCRCYKKVKKVLCKFPQIQDQVYDEKNNTVTIKVVCCSPDKIKVKICCKGGDSIKGIEIKPPPKPVKKIEPEKQEKKESEKPKQPPPPPAVVPVCPPPRGIPIGACCRECSEGYGGGPCFQGYGCRPPPCYEAYWRPVYDSYGGGYRHCYVSPCYYISEENPAGCTIM